MSNFISSLAIFASNGTNNVRLFEISFLFIFGLPRFFIYLLPIWLAMELTRHPRSISGSHTGDCLSLSAIGIVGENIVLEVNSMINWNELIKRRRYVESPLHPSTHSIHPQTLKSKHRTENTFLSICKIIRKFKRFQMVSNYRFGGGKFYQYQCHVSTFVKFV